MTIEETRDGERLTLRITGRLDTATAPQLEGWLKEELEGILTLVLDFRGLEYISSAGLRTLLAAHKTMTGRDGSMTVQGANEEVQDVFTITGFSDILHIEQ